MNETPHLGFFVISMSLMIGNIVYLRISGDPTLLAVIPTIFGIFMFLLSIAAMGMPTSSADLKKKEEIPQAPDSTYVDVHNHYYNHCCDHCCRHVDMKDHQS